MKEFLGKFSKEQKRADLHMHTIESDGNLAGWQLIEIAVESNLLHTLAFTDHDTVKPSVEAKEYGSKMGYSLEIIPGSEISTLDGHLLGIFVEHDIQPRQPIEWTLKKIHRQGGLAIVPHPFFKPVRSLTRETVINVMQSEDPEVYFDGFEVFNAGVNSYPGTTAIEQAKQFYLANKNKLGAPIGSTDGHYFTVGRGLTGYKGRLKDAIKSSQTTVHYLERDEIEKIIAVARRLFPKEVEALRGKLQTYRNRHNR